MSNKQVAEQTGKKNLSTFSDSVQITSQDCPLNLPSQNLTLRDFVCQVAGIFIPQRGFADDSMHSPPPEQLTLNKAIGQLSGDATG